MKHDKGVFELVSLTCIHIDLLHVCVSLTSICRLRNVIQITIVSFLEVLFN